MTRGKEKLEFKVGTRTNPVSKFWGQILKSYPFQDHQDQHAQQQPSQLWSELQLVESTY